MPSRFVTGLLRRADPPWWDTRAGTAGAQLARLQQLRPNFEPHELPKVRRDPWHIDDYCEPLPEEAPGEPQPEGSFEIAKRLLCDYEFADRKRVCAYYDAHAPLAGRDMLLELRYLVLRVRVGVRVSHLFDELREVDGRPARVWGWAYQTLEGHPERGQMDYQLWKWLETGAVEYRIHAVSQMAEIRDPILHFGFRLVGRREQVRFARNSGVRLQQLVRVGHACGPGALPSPEEVRGTAISPASPS